MLSRMQFDIVRASAAAIRMLLDPMGDEDELFASANTLKCVEMHLLVIAQTLAYLSPDLQSRLLRIDWRGWQVLRETLEAARRPRREEVWYGINALLPAALDLIDDLRRREPAWFDFDY
jgi:uncharacterized protein with HEPN domain